MSTLAEKIFDNMYRNPSESPVPFTETQLETKRMYEDVFAKMLTDPDLEDKEIINYMQNEYGKSLSQAYRDFNTIQHVLGNVKNASREWDLYTVKKMLKESYALAKKNGETKNMVMAADKLGKYTKLDQAAPDVTDYEKIIPPSWEPSADPTLLNIPDVPQTQRELSEYKRKLRHKYLRTNIVDAEIVDDEPNG